MTPGRNGDGGSSGADRSQYIPRTDPVEHEHEAADFWRGFLLAMGLLVVAAAFVVVFLLVVVGL